MSDTITSEFIDCCKINLTVWIIFYGSVYLICNHIFRSYFAPTKFNSVYSPNTLLIQEIFFSFVAVVIASMIETFIYHYKYIDYENSVTLNNITFNTFYNE
eukprot:24994_1